MELTTNPTSNPETLKSCSPRGSGKQRVVGIFVLLAFVGAAYLFYFAIDIDREHVVREVPVLKIPSSENPKLYLYLPAKILLGKKEENSSKPQRWIQPILSKRPLDIDLKKPAFRIAGKSWTTLPPDKVLVLVEGDGTVLTRQLPAFPSFHHQLEQIFQYTWAEQRNLNSPPAPLSPSGVLRQFQQVIPNFPSSFALKRPAPPSGNRSN